VHFIGKIDKRIYECVTKDMTTDEVIITDERIGHIDDHHPGEYENIAPFLKAAVTAPDYILQDKPHTALVLKIVEENGKRIQLVLRIHTSSDKAGYKNSVISAWRISKSRWESYLRNKHILYKRYKE